VFIQFNANADGSFVPLPARHVDTGMGFERVSGIMQCTKGFTDFLPAGFELRERCVPPLFDELQRLSGKRYTSTLPAPGTAGASEQEKIDVAFRVIADHIRTLSFAIADGIQPGNTDRHYVLRRILRRAVRYGRALGFRQPFFYKLVQVLADNMGDVFPEIRARKSAVEETLRIEEEAFNRTLDRGIELFRDESQQLARGAQIDGAFAFKLYDTYGFPLDLTELMAREQGLTVDTAGFEVNMEQQRARARAAQKKEVIEVSQISAEVATSFIGYDVMETPARVVEVISVKGRTAVLLDRSPCYAEMGGQVGDTGLLRLGGTLWRVVDTQKAGHAWLHFVEGEDAPEKGAEVTLSVDLPRRAAIQRHHTVTHLFHWALHEVANREASQKGSFVGPDKLTFDFNSGALTPGQLHDIEKLVNERILENAPVSWTELPYASVKSRKDVMQFFGDKYGETVRVVQIGGVAGQLDGYSMELCGGTHTRATGEIGLFRVVSEGAIAAGVRRVEAVAGLAAWQRNADDLRILKSVSGTLNIAPAELEKRVEAVLAHQKELEKQLKALKLGQAGDQARALESRGTMVNGIPLIVAHLGDADGDTVAAVAESLKAKVKGVVVLGAAAGGSVVLLAQVSPEFTAKVQAGKIIQAIAPIVGGKGGGKPDFARGGGKDAAKLDEALAKVPGLLGG
jgi:alanyl-tRNA synthetase